MEPGWISDGDDEPKMNKGVLEMNNGAFRPETRGPIIRLSQSWLAHHTKQELYSTSLGVNLFRYVQLILQNKYRPGH